MQYYILKGKMVATTTNATVWAKFMQRGTVVVNHTQLEGVSISTVFLGLDHSFGRTERPILFETMIFGGVHDEYQDRYSTWNEAVEGHIKASKLVLTTIEPIKQN